jgi:hypothetical protein
MPLNDCVRLVKAAHMYGLKRLHQMCEQHLQSSLTMQNIFELIRFSDAEKVPTAKKICLEFCIANNKEFIMDSRVESLAIGLFQEIIISKERAAAVDGWQPEKMAVTEESTIRRDFRKIYDDMPLADAVFEVDGQKIKCHRAILSHMSAKLENVMETAKKEPFKLPEKEWKTFSAEAFHSLLKFLYCYDTDIKPLPATQLINFAKDFGVAHLADVCENKIRSGIAKNTVLSIMEVAYHPLMDDKPELQKELRINCSRFFTENIKDIDLEPLKDMKAEVATDLLLAMQKEIGKTWITDAAKSGNSGEEGPKTARGHKSENSDAEKLTKKSKNSSSTTDLPTVTVESPKGETTAADAPATPSSEKKDEEKAEEKSAEEKPAADAAKKDDASAETPKAGNGAVADGDKPVDTPKKEETKPETPKAEAAAETETSPETPKDDGKKDKKKDKKKEKEEPAPVPEETVSPRKEADKKKEKEKEKEKEKSKKK